MSKIRDLSAKLLSNEIFHFYNSQVKYQYFPSHLEKLLKEYVKVITNRDFWEELYGVYYSNDNDAMQGFKVFPTAINELCEGIIRSVNSYYKGYVKDAYKYLEDGLVRGINYNREDLSIFKETSKTYLSGELKLYRIRLRKKNSYNEFLREEMFHIPFEKRGNVLTQRFSIPGHPSLYLGGSIYVCWEELEQPQVNLIYGSRFENSKPLNIIELIRTEDLLSITEGMDDRSFSREILRFMLTFPLNIACSIKTKNRDDVFKPEYIIPQLFLQFIMEHKEQIDGIKYYSTRINYNRIENVGPYNYVFPTRTINETGHCSVLKDKFALTDPVLWEYEQISRENFGARMGNGPRKGISIELYKGRKVPYDWTAFFAIESALDFSGMILKNIP
jgi:hypothetical protein